MPAIDLEENGFLDLQVPVDGQSEKVPVRLDIELAAERFKKAATDSGNDSEAFTRNLADAMTEFGIPPVSYRLRMQIVEKVWDLSRDFQKKEEATTPRDDERGSLGTTN